MSEMMRKISAGLEQAFAKGGFAEPSVEDLRDAAGVSLRTLYKYTPSRSEMVLAALEHRHRRYLARVFEDLPQEPAAALEALLSRVGDWMASETAHGCLFHAAVAADPASQPLRELLERHKAEVAARAAMATGLGGAGLGGDSVGVDSVGADSRGEGSGGAETALLVIIEGLTQAWPLRGDEAVLAAKRLGRALQSATL
ncbi:TetR family transcriptional regulator [Pararhodobacter oceanensis]|uniref:TetR family transcriptional regulator n=2 Tax=Pararhodobacter oceanensis TaxID=2172121 RepID=A0A2T8HRL8_9RHOB|nr:TetR family transcriptional regulator [Pararhodobacter oceanensis]